jgi:starvation-inducible DNA-binding protein
MNHPNSSKHFIHSLPTQQKCKIFISKLAIKAKNAFDNPLLIPKMPVLHNPDTLRETHYLRTQLIQSLNHLLSDTFTLYLMSRNFHWNIAGPRHQTLHHLFEEHYKELGDALDEIAARIRAFGGRAAATYQEYQTLSTLKEPAIDMNASDMVCHAGIGHHQALKAVQHALEIAQKLKDITTEDLLSELSGLHEKCARELGGVFINN